ncbi:MAG: family 16 glycoside hydrolase [Planctomycetaceae bacterium]
MPRPVSTMIAATLLLTLGLPLDAADVPESAELEGELILRDDFQRDEPEEGKEAIGNGWTSNSAWRAKGTQQVDLQDGVMAVTRAEVADHGVAIFHDVSFRDGSVKLKFKLRPGDDLGIDFVDRELKTVHAGHLCMARVTLKQATLLDSKTGNMNLELREKRLNNQLTTEDKQLLERTWKKVPLELDAKVWHDLLVVVQGDKMTLTIDGEVVGEFQSEGIAHPTKRMITLAVNKSAWIDDVEVRRLR